MNKNRKKLFVIPCSLLAISALSYAGYEYTKNNTPIPESLTSKVNEIKKISYANKVSDIVVTDITDDGYVTLHGDHSHFEKGLVPYNAKFLDKLVLNDKNYKLKNEDIQYEVSQGYIIKVNGKYYYYPKEGVSQNNIVDEQTAKTISTSSNQHHHNDSSSKHEDNYTFNPKDIVGETEDGYIVRHGDHYHFIKKSELNSSDLNMAMKTTFNNTLNTASGIISPTSDGYIFKGESDIIGRNSFGFIVSHGSHSHIIPYESLRGTKWEYLLNSNNNFSSQPSINNTNNDNYKFDPKDIVAEDEHGYTVRHDDHYHYIYKEKKENNLVSVPTKTQHNVKIDKEVEEKIEYLAKLLNIDKETIKIVETSKGKALIYPHGDHSHTVFLEEIQLGNNGNTVDKDIEKQIDYIAEVYGVPKEAVRVTSDFFIFNEPTHEYDPTHIHPYLIPRNKFRIPQVTGDKEVDFEQELLALAERTGIDPDKIKVEDDQFVIPHGSHNHYVKIKSGGAEEYLKNKIPNIIGTYIMGGFNKDIVLNKINELIQNNTTINKNTKETNRINRALTQLKSSIENDIPTNSTNGYLAMLENFDKKYIHIDLNEVNTENEKITKIYNELLNRLKDSNIEHLGYEKEKLIEELNIASTNHNEDTFKKLEHLLNEVEKFNSQPSPTILSYTKYFLKNITSNKIDNELREELSELIKYAYLGEAQLTESYSTEIIARLINAKNILHFQLENNDEYQVEFGENYKKINEKFNDDDEYSILDSATNFINDISDFLPELTFSSITDKNELVIQFNKVNIEVETHKTTTFDDEDNKHNTEDINNSTSTSIEMNNQNSENNEEDTTYSSENLPTTLEKTEDNVLPSSEVDNESQDFSTELSNNIQNTSLDISEETSDGFIVRHGEHSHYLYKKDLTSEQIKQFQNLLKNK